MILARRLHLLPAALFVASCAGHEASQAPTTAPNAPHGPAPTGGASATSSGPEPAALSPATPDAIAIPATQGVIVKALGKGVQIYVCKSKESAPTAFEWTLKAPEAELFDDAGKKIGKHYAGPTWEAADGSKVVGKLKAKVDAPEGSAIPWLLLNAQSNEGDGLFAKVRSIQRVATVGGKAPAGGCDAAHVGAETRVDYTATYFMYGP